MLPQSTSQDFGEGEDQVVHDSLLFSSTLGHKDSYYSPRPSAHPSLSISSPMSWHDSSLPPSSPFGSPMESSSPVPFGEEHSDQGSPSEIPLPYDSAFSVASSELSSPAPSSPSSPLCPLDQGVDSPGSPSLSQELSLPSEYLRRRCPMCFGGRRYAVQGYV